LKKGSWNSKNFNTYQFILKVFEGFQGKLFSKSFPWPYPFKQQFASPLYGLVLLYISFLKFPKFMYPKKIHA